MAETQNGIVNMSEKRYSTAKIVTAILFLTACTGASVAFSNLTLVPFIWTAAVVLVVAILTGLPAAGWWRWLTGSQHRLPNFLCHVVCTGITLLTMFYTLNYCCADDATAHHEEATVVRKYTQTRYKSRRIRRNVYGRGEPYTVYCIDLRYACGIEKRKELNAASYRQTQTGDMIDVSVRRGLFGVNVVK